MSNSNHKQCAYRVSQLSPPSCLEVSFGVDSRRCSDFVRYGYRISSSLDPTTWSYHKTTIHIQGNPDGGVGPTANCSSPASRVTQVSGSTAAQVAVNIPRIVWRHLQCWPTGRIVSGQVSSCFMPCTRAARHPLISGCPLSGLDRLWPRLGPRLAWLSASAAAFSAS